MKRALIAALIAAGLGLSACETVPTRYVPSAGASSVGYSDYRIEPGRYRITFRGGPGAPPNQVEDYALLRAADLALRDGYDWFEVVEGYGERNGQRSGSSVSIGGGGGSFGRHSGFGVGVGTTFDLSGGPAYSRTIEVVMGKGPRPDRPHTYDARGVRDSIGPRA
jgi:hypothetical protein